MQNIQKYSTSILLVAGTCIGGGTIALPMALAKLGIFPSLILMLGTWLLTYYTSLVSVELNLQSEQGLSLGLLGRAFSGRIAEWIGEISVKLLSYALLAVFIYGGSSILQKLIEAYWTIATSSIWIESILSLSVIFILLLPMKSLSKLNNIAFLIFSVIFLVLIGILAADTDWTCVPWLVKPNVNSILSVITIVFTSFGYQVIFHTLRDYCGRNPRMLKTVFFYGSLIPTLVYMLWTTCTLCVIYKARPSFFYQMVCGHVDVGDLVRELSSISGLPSLQILIWWMSILAILTSIFGVGLGLTESWYSLLKKHNSSTILLKLKAACLTIAPAYALAALIPNAFLRILGFAGAILVVIAILLPVYLWWETDFEKSYIPSLKKGPLSICVVIGLGIMWVEFLTH